MRKIGSGFLAFWLSACAAPAIVQDRAVDVFIPVPVPCALPRPAAPVPLRDRLSEAEWGALDARQRAAEVGRQALAWQSYAEALNAATGACPEA